MRIRLFICALAFLAASSLQAQVQVTDIDGAPNFRLADDDNSTPFIWAGIAGPTCSTSTTELCNNCAAAPSGSEQACNLERINSNTVLRISFTVTGDITGNIRLGYSVGGGAYQAETNFTSSSSGSLKKGDTGFVEVQWGEICAALGDSTCNSDGDDTGMANGNELKIYLGISTSSEPASASRIAVQAYVHMPTADTSIDTLFCTDTLASGVCQFHAIPGDEKIYVKDLNNTSAFPENNSVRLLYLRVFISEISFDDADYGSTNYVDLDIPEGEDPTPTPGVVTGLVNGTPYFFRPAGVDFAMNVAYLADVSEATSFPATCDGTTDSLCDMIATPLPVYGLLTEDYNCFISTAAFGSSFASEVQTFRDFRNRYMIDHSFGVQLRNAYYKYGPMAARWIHENAWTKPFVRTALYPALWYSKVSLRHGIQTANWIFTTIFLSLIATLIISLRSYQQWRTQKA